MPSNNNLIVGLIGEIIRKIGGGGKREGGVSAVEIFLALLALSILLVIAAAPFKILLRRNFGNNTVNFVEAIFGAVFFGLWALLAGSFAMDSHSHTGFYEAYFLNPVIMSVISVFLSAIAIATLIKGIVEDSKNKFNHDSNWLADNFRGQSILYGKYIKDPYMQFKVWRKIEPGFCFKWSFLLLIIHPLLGFPLLFASTAFWLNEYYHVKYKWERIDFHGFSGDGGSAANAFSGAS